MNAVGIERLPLVACARHRFAELIALSFTRTLIYLQRSVATDYIMAQAEARASRGGFERRIAIRDGKPFVEINRMRWAHRIYVNEEHSLLYCSIPKVASTSFLLWMRRLQGLPEIEGQKTRNFHKLGVNGIKRLSSNFTELQAVKILTDSGVYKFVFVRNPWKRILEVYLDKVMKGGLERSRYYWYHKFFAPLQEPIFYNKKKRHPYVSFFAVCPVYRADVKAV